MAEVEDDEWTSDSDADQSVITPNDTHLDNPDCIRLTEDQYKCIAELGKDPKFSGTASTKLTFPSWTDLMNGTKDTFMWVVFSSYLGVLKFGFISKGVDGGIILYDKILLIFERQLEAAVAERNAARLKKNVYKPPSVMALCFHHIGEGQFIVNLDLSHRRYNVPDMIGEPENEMKKLASEAFLVNRSRNPTAGLTHSARLQEPVKHLPGNEQVDTADLVDVMEGYQSTAFCEELKRTVAYIGQQMELKGEEVYWEGLQTDLTVRLTTKHQLLKEMGKAIDERIQMYGHSKLSGMELVEDPPLARLTKRRRKPPSRPKTLRRKAISRPKRKLMLQPGGISKSYKTPETVDSDSSSD